MSDVNACYVWDFTLSGEFCDDYQKVILSFKGRSKKWGFQKEQSESGYIHWQGRMSLIKPKRQAHLVAKLFKDTFLEKASFSITSAENKDNFDYTEKVDTRIAGPWKFDDIVVPRQVREIEKLWNWQQDVVNDIGVWNTRVINVLLDTNGNIGKSTLVSYIRAYNLGRKIPAVNDYKDLMRMVCDMPTSNMYLVDMPRCMSKKGLLGFFGALEEIKNGYAWDDRYSFKEKMFDCPNIWLFTNELPDKNLLSHDRWKLWEVDLEGNLKPFTPPDDWGKRQDNNEGD